ncbi:MAG: bifunctional glycosyltransferase/CDP-glycerol:glycerophosphate glycerophosphotransferase [Lachnospiraceae bacterium]
MDKKEAKRYYEYLVSIIVPVYNTEKQLAKCLESLASQTMDLINMEVLLINDGSTDGSLDICNEYVRSYPGFKVFSQNNSGPSVARNLGFSVAQGKYIMFLDSDDTYEPETVEKVIDFFEAHYNEIDLVSYWDEYYKDGQKLPSHARYNYLKKTGIYDLKKSIYALQVRLNICIKNKFENNIFFDISMKYQEDQKYCCEILRDKLKMGFVKEAKYNYIQNSSGIVSTSTNPINMFDKTTTFFEEVFGWYENKSVPQYYQALYIHDFGWKLNQHVLFPYQYHGDEFNYAINRLKSLMDKVDAEVIINSQTVDLFHRYYMLGFGTKNKIMVYSEPGHIRVMSEAEVIRHEKSCEIIINKIKVNDNRFLLLATLKTVYGSFIVKPKVYIQEKDRNGNVKKTCMELFISSDSYYKARIISNVFWSFYYECDMDNIESANIYVDIDGFEYPTRYYLMPYLQFNKKYNRNRIVLGNYILKLNNTTFSFASSPAEERNNLIEHNTSLLGADNRAISLRREVLKTLCDKIWLYYDCKGAGGGNGLLQFLNDIVKDDGIKRYYVYNDKINELLEYFPKELLEHTIRFGSRKHKICFIAANKILTAYIEQYNYNPFSVIELQKYSDLINYELIYLQHGILHASLPWKYTPERSLADKVVASSYFEKKNFNVNYNFRECDIIDTGMARYDFIKRERDVKDKRILFAPSWRQYLIDQESNGDWIPVPTKFIESNYFLQFQNFLLNQRLIEVLEKNDVYMDVKLHPIFECYSNCFKIKSNRIRLIDKALAQEQYSIFITDFSSYLFDFSYLYMPLIYFMPDMLEFSAGLNQYKSLDFGFDEGFGILAEDQEDVVNEIDKIIANDFTMEKKFKERVDAFYLPLQDCRAELYQRLISD